MQVNSVQPKHTSVQPLEVAKHHPLLVLEANPLPVTTLLLLTAGLFLHLQVRQAHFKMPRLKNETERFLFYYSVSLLFKVSGIRPCCWVHRPFYGWVVFLGIHVSCQFPPAGWRPTSFRFELLRINLLWTFLPKFSFFFFFMDICFYFSWVKT